MAPPRRSGRARNPTEDEASSAAEASIPSVDTSPRKRKRGAASPSTSDASASQSVDVTPTKPSADAVAPEVNVNGGSSSGQRGTEKKVGRPPKHNKVNEESTNGINGATATASGSKAGLQSLEAAGADETSVLTSAEELWLEKADADKLKAVLESFFPHLLALPLPPGSNVRSQTSDKGKATVQPPPSSNLIDALDGRKITLRQLRAFVLALKKSPPTSQVMSPKASKRRGVLQTAEVKIERSQQEQAERLSKDLTLLLSLIEEVARRMRRAEQGHSSMDIAQYQNKGIKKEEAEDAALEELLKGVDQPRAGTTRLKYSLHMRLPTGDYFTKAIELTPEQVSQIDTGLADLIPIETPLTSAASSSSAPLPTLGERIHRGTSLRYQDKSFEDLREQRLPKIQPVVNLNYGSFLSSLAPSYDSSLSSVSRAASNVIWRGKLDPNVWAAKRKWSKLEEGESIEEDIVNDEIPAPPTFASLQRTVEDDAKLLQGLDPSFDPNLIELGLKGLERQSALQQQIDQNAALLGELQEMQEERLRRGYARIKDLQEKDAKLETSPQLRSKGNGKQTFIPEDQPSDAEQEVASQLLDGLTRLIALRPRGSDEESSSLLPDTKTLRTLARSAAIDPVYQKDSAKAALPGFWGTLDPAFYGPQARAPRFPPAPGHKNAPLAPPVIPSFASNETVRLDSKGEEVAVENTSKLYGRSLGVSKDTGAGLLERWAGSESEKLALPPNTSGLATPAGGPSTALPGGFPAGPYPYGGLPPANFTPAYSMNGSGPPPGSGMMMPPPATGGHPRGQYGQPPMRPSYPPGQATNLPLGSPPPSTGAGMAPGHRGPSVASVRTPQGASGAFAPPVPCGAFAPPGSQQPQQQQQNYSHLPPHYPRSNSSSSHPATGPYHALVAGGAGSPPPVPAGSPRR